MERPTRVFTPIIWTNGSEKICCSNFGFAFQDKNGVAHRMGPTLQRVIKKLEKMERYDIAETLRNS
ncbi:MAG: hypothetical protein E6713_07995 [Sporomusaceae bacterium]|nr:hypothetical protein [Sporomusaceae bacterium]